MSALGQKRTLARLIDHLVGGGKQCGRNGETKYFRGLQIDYQLELRCQIDWDVARLCSIEDLGDATGARTITIGFLEMLLSYRSCYSARLDAERFGKRLR
jgi:hypothetical protein